jgi:hypothetical protein
LIERRYVDDGQSDGQIEQQILDLLRGTERRGHLAFLGLWLTHAARGSYVAAGATPELSSTELACLNEVTMRVFEQLAADEGNTGIGHPDEALARRLVEQAAIGGCDRQLGWAVRKAVSRSSEEA